MGKQSKRTGGMTMTRSECQWMFELEPMLGKPLTCVPGIGETTSMRLKDKNIDKAEELFGMWLTMHRDEEKFGAWLQNAISCSSRTVQTIHNAFIDWNHTFLEH